jgi:hypothetical protein
LFENEVFMKKTKLSDMLSTEIMASLEDSHEFMTDCGGRPRYRGHAIVRGSPCWYSHCDGYDYLLNKGEYDLRAISRMLAERNGAYTIGTDPAFAVRFKRAVMKLIQAGKLELAYPGRTIVRRAVKLPTDAQNADSDGDQAEGVS